MVYKETKQNKYSATHCKGLLTPLVTGHAPSFNCGLKHWWLPFSGFSWQTLSRNPCPCFSAPKSPENKEQWLVLGLHIIPASHLAPFTCQLSNKHPPPPVWCSPTSNMSESSSEAVKIGFTSMLIFSINAHACTLCKNQEGLFKFNVSQTWTFEKQATHAWEAIHV